MPFFSILLLLGNFHQGVALSKDGFYEESEALLSLVDPLKVPDPVELNFRRMVNNVKLNRKARAEAFTDALLDEFHPMPARYRSLAQIVRADLDTWHEHPAGDISRDMSGIANRLAQGKAGPKTQAAQAEVIRKLDKMIKSAEDAAAAARAARDKKNNPGAERNGQGRPLEDSIPAAEQGRGEVDQKRVREVAASWGKLPEKERARAMVELTRGMPPKYREAIEAYFRKLNRGTR